MRPHSPGQCRPPPTCPDTWWWISTDGHHEHQARAGQSWRGQHQSELPPTPGHTSNQAILTFYVWSLTDHRFLLNELKFSSLNFLLYSTNCPVSSIRFIIKNRWMDEWKMNIFRTNDAKLNLYSTYDKSFERLQMKSLVLVVISYKPVIFYIYYVHFSLKKVWIFTRVIFYVSVGGRILIQDYSNWILLLYLRCFLFNYSSYL